MLLSRADPFPISGYPVAGFASAARRLIFGLILSHYSLLRALFYVPE